MGAVSHRTKTVAARVIDDASEPVQLEFSFEEMLTSQKEIGNWYARDPA
jgi:hypothetical protein